MESVSAEGSGKPHSELPKKKKSDIKVEVKGRPAGPPPVPTKYLARTFGVNDDSG